MIVGPLTCLMMLEPLVRFAPTDVACPTAAAVEAQLAAVLSTSAADTALDVATLERKGPALTVSVNRPDGTPVGRRTFQGAHPCADLASAVALTIATWESDVHPEFVLAPPAAPEDARRSEPPPPPGAVPAEPSAPVDTAVSPPERTAPLAAPVALDFDVGAALATQAAPSRNDGVLDPALALGLTLLGGVAPAAGGLGARLALGASTERAVPLAGGEARWQRATGSLGPMWRLRLGRASAPSFDAGTALDLHAEILLAALDVRGVGFSPNTSGWSFDAGGGAGVRVWLGHGRWRPSIDLGLAYWPRDHVAFASPSPEGSRLPRVDFSLALGISLAGPARPGNAAPVAAIESSTGS